MGSARAFVHDLVRLKWYMAVSAALFAGGVWIGYASDLFDSFLFSQVEPLRETVELLEAMENTQVWMFLFIFFNNFIKSAAVVFLGALFGLFPVVFLVLNGLLLGFVVSAAAGTAASASTIIVQGIVPHGVLELTAVTIASAYGLRYGSLVFLELMSALRGRTRGTGRGSIREFHGTLKRLMAFLFLALLAAAFIESTVTYFLIRG